jgi:hypothetical protein
MNSGDIYGGKSVEWSAYGVSWLILLAMWVGVVVNVARRT